MRELYIVVALMTFQNVNPNKYDGALQVFAHFFIRRHVQTITAYTCWSCDADKKLLESLSTKDISTSFRLSPWSVWETSLPRVTWYRHAFLIDLSCNASRNMFQQISNRRLFDAQNDWVLFSRNRVVDETSATLSALKIFDAHFKDAYVLPDSGVFLFQDTGDDVWEVWNGFRASKSDTMRVFKMATSSPNFLNVSDSLYAERQNFRGITLKANSVIVNKENFFGFDKKISSDLDVFSHMHYEMIVTLSQQLNFKIDLNINDEYGWSFGNGTFGGLMGVLQKDEIDLSAAGVFMRSDRMAVVDYTIGTMSLRTTALFKQPLLSSVHDILLLPFTFELWLIILLIFFVFVFMILLSTSMNYRSENQRKYSLNIQETVQLVHGALCQQGSIFKSNLESTRVVIFVLFFTSLFMFTSYSASISALVQSNSNSIKSVRDIVELPMTFSAQISPYGKYYFEETDDPLIKTLYKSKMAPTKNNGFTKASVGVEKIRTEFHGFLVVSSVEVISAYKIISSEWRNEEKCGLSEIQLFTSAPLSIPLVKKSGHKDIFKQKLIQQMEIGLVKRTTNQWIAPKPSCSSSSRKNLYVSVSIKDIYLTLKVFGCGVCISLSILALEMAFHYRTKYIKSTKRKIHFDNNFTPSVLVQTIQSNK